MEIWFAAAEEHYIYVYLSTFMEKAFSYSA